MSEYRTVFRAEAQAELRKVPRDMALRILAKLAELEKSGRFRRPIVTQIEPAPPFYRAEEYHQQYLAKRGRTHCAI